MRKAIIDAGTGLVENIIIADNAYEAPVGKLVLDAGDARIGGTWDGQTFQPAPPPPEPTLEEKLAPTDKDMARVAEDVVVLLIDNNVIPKASFDPVIIDKINNRRTIRGQTPI